MADDEPGIAAEAPAPPRHGMAAEFFASGFYIGYAPKAPGTFGSIFGLAIATALLTEGHLPLVFGILVASALGLWSIAGSGAADRDPGWIVIDEIAGQMIAALALDRISVLGLLVAFGLFRLFDIWKPGPVGWADRRHDEWGVMGDDWIAGGLAACCILLIDLAVNL
jgi:phosphatidylglycerophosphatase A